MQRRRSIDFREGLDTPMAGHGGQRRKQPMGVQQLEKFRDGVSKLNDNELARQYRYLHGRLTLEDGVPTQNARVVQEFVQIWREAHRRHRVNSILVVMELAEVKSLCSLETALLDLPAMRGLTEPVRERISRQADDASPSVISLFVTVVATVLIVAAIYISALFVARELGLFGSAAS